MAESNTGEALPKPSAGLHELEEVVRTMGLIFTNTFLYGPKHGVTVKAADECFDLLVQVLQKCGDISFSASEAGLSVNDMVIELKNPLMRAFATRMSDLEISSFGMKEGLDRANFDKLIELMNTKVEELKAAGGFAQAVLLVKIEGVRTRVVTYKAVTEDEIVVSKKSLEGLATEGGATVEEMVAFLSGGGEGSSGKGTGADETEKDQAARLEREQRGIQQMAADPGRLSDVIMQAAEVGQKQAGAQNQQEATAVLLGCLKKVYEALSKSPIVKTQKGKRALSKTLSALETEILARMRAQAAQGDDVSKRAEEVSEAIGAMNDELEIDALATEYMRKRNAIESNEQRILRFIQSKGLDDIKGTELRQKLEEGGLNALQWQELLAKSGVGRGKGSGGAEGDVSVPAGHLAVLLANMQGLLAGKVADGHADSPPPTQTAEQLTTVVAAVDQEIRELVVKTEQRINELVQVVTAEEQKIPADGGSEAKPGTPKALSSRKRLLVFLAEVVQELCQPLSVINCSIDMIKSKHLGEVTESQLEMLNLAATSGERVRILVEKLLELSGLPGTLTPDAGIQSSLYTPE